MQQFGLGMNFFVKFWNCSFVFLFLFQLFLCYFFAQSQRAACLRLSVCSLLTSNARRLSSQQPRRLAEKKISSRVSSHQKVNKFCFKILDFSKLFVNEKKYVVAVQFVIEKRRLDTQQSKF